MTNSFSWILVLTFCCVASSQVVRYDGWQVWIPVSQLSAAQNQVLSDFSSQNKGESVLFFGRILVAPSKQDQFQALITQNGINVELAWNDFQA